MGSKAAAPLACQGVVSCCVKVTDNAIKSSLRRGPGRLSGAQSEPFCCGRMKLLPFIECNWQCIKQMHRRGML